MIFSTSFEIQDKLRQAITNAYRVDETIFINHLIDYIKMPETMVSLIQQHAAELINTARSQQHNKSPLEAFLFEYDLSSEEGTALMCLAEALLRIPDKSTIDRLIRDKLTAADWHKHLKNSDSFTINAATWGLMLTGKVLSHHERQTQSRSVGDAIKRIIARSGEPIIRGAVGQAMKIMSRQFVMARTIEEGLSRAKNNEKKGYRYSYDMLGEAAVTQKDADTYFEAYMHSITVLGTVADSKNVHENPAISITLSALHPRYEAEKSERVIEALTPKLFSLARQAKAMNIGFTVDAEEADRLDLSLDIIGSVFSDPSFENWDGCGLALQSYQKRAFYIIDWLVELARRSERRFNVRLIKGAYWDSEIKESQRMGLSGYPVFTRKSATDVSFLACAKKLLAHQEFLYPQFATHNAYSISAVLTLLEPGQDFEFQCLHGMGQDLYDQLVGEDNKNITCRIYAPVGSHDALLPYLVRRLLENGANSSFVNRLADKNTTVESLCVDPIAQVRALDHKPHPNIPLPQNIFAPFRKNSYGYDLSNRTFLQHLDAALFHAANQAWTVAPILKGQEHFDSGSLVLSPSDKTCQVGKVQEATAEEIELALSHAKHAHNSWDQLLVNKRAEYLEKAADLFEKHHADLMYLLVREAGKTIDDAIAELREAVDFCRYYAACAKQQLMQLCLPGYTGEDNVLNYHGRGVIVCISPWNFPMAIFTGQIAAALVTGNSVIAKPAEQTPLIAGMIVRLFHAAGIPGDVLQLLPGKGNVVGKQLTGDPRVNGVLFTGSTATAKLIQQTLAQSEGPIATFVAETGGLNAMIVDSSALLEQVVNDVVRSAFYSAGQRCSACRILCLQEEIAEPAIEMLKGAMEELVIGDPALLNTDIGPVIDAQAKVTLESHLSQIINEGELIYQCSLPESCRDGMYFSPCLIKLPSLSLLSQEVFGPILHVVTYKASELDKVITELNQTGYGLTLGIHSRINETIDYIQRRAQVGNCYVNRDMVGAVVGVQPFGGEGLSGTGPKAGGPNYLARLCTERTVTVNTTAAGGNASLMSLNP